MTEIIAKVTVHPDDLIKFAEAYDKAIQKAITDLATGALNHWVTLAKASKEMHGGRDGLQDEYVRSLSMRSVNKYQSEVFLNAQGQRGWLVFGLEAGLRPFSISGPMMNSGKKYLTHWSQYAKVMGPGTKKLPGQHPIAHIGPPFIDVPIHRKKGSNSKPDQFVLVSPRNPNRLKHPGFKPLGSGGLSTPLHVKVLDHIEQILPRVLKDAGVVGDVSVMRKK